MSFMGSSKGVLLVHKGMQPIKNGGPFDVMLTPQFYTYKREELPVRYLYQAKKLAPSVLESLLAEGVVYEYFVYKEGDAWAFIAYDPAEISEFLDSVGVGIEQVSKLYFAQQVPEKFSKPVRLNFTETLTTVQGTVTIVPKKLMPIETEYQPFDETFIPKNGVSFGAGVSSVIGRKEAGVLSAILILFALMFAAEGVRYQKEIDTMWQTVDALFKEYPALQSQYARENIAQKYRKIDRQERHKREVLKSFSRLILPGVKVEELVMDGKRVSLALQCPDEKTLSRVKALAEAKQYKFVRSGTQKIVKVEGPL